MFLIPADHVRGVVDHSSVVFHLGYLLWPGQELVQGGL